MSWAFAWRWARRKMTWYGWWCAQAMTLALFGSFCGLVAALALTRMMSTFLYGVRPIDLPTYVVCCRRH